jgi:hypothetical protein
MEELNQFGKYMHGSVIMKLSYSYLKQIKCIFPKTKDRKVKQSCLGVDTSGRGRI